MTVAELPLADTLARPLRDLRISVTDRCQFRCTYCMPREIFGRDFAFLPREQLLTFEELARLARVFAGLGVRKLRLTGGEPLLRRDVERLVAMLARVGGIQDIALATNGALLAGKARALAAAGLRRVTVSLDSLDDTTFMALNDVGFPVARVLEAIAAAADAGLAPVKANMVVRRGVNGQSVLPMAAHFRHSGHVLRFIEYMPLDADCAWQRDKVLFAHEIIETLSQEIMPLIPVADQNKNAPATHGLKISGALHGPKLPDAKHGTGHGIFQAHRIGHQRPDVGMRLQNQRYALDRRGVRALPALR